MTTSDTPSTTGSSAMDADPAAPADTTAHEELSRRDVVRREKEEFGGVKIGSAFFGWLTATGTSVILLALLAAAGTAFAVATDTSTSDAANAANSAGVDTVGLAGGIALLVVLFVSYYCGGYVAGRMARFQGLRQGIATWVWGIVMIVAAAILSAAAGAKYNVLERLDLPRLPVNEGDVTTAGVVALAAAVVASLIGAMLGGLAGMRFHRRVDKAGLRDLTIQS